MRPLLIMLLLGNIALAQPLELKKDQSGIFSLGVRSTVSAFNDHEYGNTGFGYGGQFRIQFADRVNSEWYLDYLTGPIKFDDKVYGHRTDYHIGWSVAYYFTDKLAPPIKPYAVVGHCFDRTELRSNGDSGEFMKKGSSAIQAGAGVHFNLSERLDLTLVGQYMFHLGEDVHADLHDGALEFHREKGAGLEGHMLFNLSINYKIADLWGK